MTETPHLLRPRAASQYLLDHWGIRHTEQTLARKRHEGTGPLFRLAGRDVSYAPSALDDYASKILAPKEFRSTAEAKAYAAAA